MNLRAHGHVSLPSTPNHGSIGHPALTLTAFKEPVLSLEEVRVTVCDAVGWSYSLSSIRRWLSRHHLHPVVLSKHFRGYSRAAVRAAIRKDLQTDIVAAGITTSIITTGK